MMNRIAMLCLVLFLLFAFVGCTVNEMQEYQFLAISTTPSGSSGETQENENSGQTTQSQQTAELKFEYSAETAPHQILSGKMQFTVSNSRVATHRKDMPGGDFSEAIAEIWMNGEVKEYVCYSQRFPSFILDDGSFVEGAKLVMVDVTVTNVDAKMRTQKDADENGKGGGDYIDPYVFRVDSLLGFADTKETTDAISAFGGVSSTGNYPQLNACYFSLLNECEEHSSAFRLEPGETMTYTVGIVVGNNQDGSERDLSAIVVRVASAKHIGGTESSVYYVSLGLGGE